MFAAAPIQWVRNAALSVLSKSVRERLHADESFDAVLEVYGFNDWLIRMLHDYRCHQVILIQPDDRKKCKTDRRDAATWWEYLESCYDDRP